MLLDDCDHLLMLLFMVFEKRYSDEINPRP